MLVAPSRIELLTDLTSIDESAWDRIIGVSPTRTIFQTLAWMSAWWDVFGRGKLLLIAAYQDDQLTAIAPLFADHGMVFFIGSGGSDYLDFVGEANRPEVLHAILDLAREETPEFVGFRFYHVPDRSPTNRSLQSVASELDLKCFDEGSLLAPSLRFPDWPADKRPPAEKKSLVRHERAIKKIGRLDVEHFDDSAQVHPVLPDFFDQHIARWAGTPFPSLFLEEKQQDFYRRLVETMGPRGWLRFCRVSLDDEAVAFHLGFLFQDTFLWYKPSYDIELARQSPGEVLLRALLLRCQEEHAEVFDFGLGDEPFKQRFATENGQVRTWGLYPAKNGTAK